MGCAPVQAHPVPMARCHACGDEWPILGADLWPVTPAKPHVCRAPWWRKAWVYVCAWLFWLKESVLYELWKLRTGTSEEEAQRGFDDLIALLRRKLEEARRG